MKRIILVGLVAFTTLSFTSCMKEYTCKRADGTACGTVKYFSKSKAKEACEERTDGECSL